MPFARTPAAGWGPGCETMGPARGDEEGVPATTEEWPQVSPAIPDDRVPRWAFVPWLHELIEARSPRIRPLGDLTEANAIMRRLADDTHHSVWNMQRAGLAGDLLLMLDQVEEIRSRGIESRPIYSRGAVLLNPLLTSVVPDIRIGPVTDAFMVVDRRVVVVNDAHARTIWTSDDPDVVARGAAYFEAEWAAATPAVPPGEDPPFTRRMSVVGAHLATGRTDREIARAMNLSERTVSTEVKEISRRLGATGRAHAIARLNGAA